MICLEVPQTQMHFKAEGDAVFGGFQTCPARLFFDILCATNPQPGQQLQRATRAQMNTHRKDFTTSLILQQRISAAGNWAQFRKTSQLSQVHDHIHTCSPQ